MPIKIIDNIVIRGSKLYYIFLCNNGLSNNGLSNNGLSNNRLYRCNDQSNRVFNECPPLCITGFKVCPLVLDECPFKGGAVPALCHTARN